MEHLDRHRFRRLDHQFHHRRSDSILLGHAFAHLLVVRLMVRIHYVGLRVVADVTR